MRASARFFLSDSTDIVRQSPERARGSGPRATSRPTARARGDETTRVRLRTVSDRGPRRRRATRTYPKWIQICIGKRNESSSFFNHAANDPRPKTPRPQPGAQRRAHTAPNTHRTHRTHTRPHAAPALSGPCTQAPSGDSSEPIQSSSRIRRQGEPRRSLHSSRRSAERPRTRRGTPPDRGCRGGTTA